MKKYVIVDIDGTISELSENRKRFVKEQDWYNFHHSCDEDKPIKDIIEIVKLLSYHYTIIFCTGRTNYDKVIDKTILWINENTNITCVYNINLLMRKDGDIRSDVEVKPELLRDKTIVPENVLCIFEDRNMMVEKWRKLGFICLQPINGNF